MLSLPPSVRLYVSTAPLDMRNYVQWALMRSPEHDRRCWWVPAGPALCITLSGVYSLSIAISLSGAVKHPGRRKGAAPASNAASFSVGSARR